MLWRMGKYYKPGFLYNSSMLKKPFCSLLVFWLGVVSSSAFADCWRLENGEIVDELPMAGTSFHAAKVACPSTLQFVPRECPGNSQFNGQVCACAEGTKWDGASCQAIPGYAGKAAAKRNPYPVTGEIRQHYGEPVNGNPEKIRAGVDILVKGGTPVYSMSAGKVVKVSKITRESGFVIVIAEPGGGAKAYRYLAPRLFVGDQVESGQVLGKVWSHHLQYNICRSVAFCEEEALPTAPNSAGLPAFEDGPFMPVAPSAPGAEARP
ncbi:hypothetical protein MTYP_01189 [Methylophilaceae bacterium]|nr:hypothetical protein MTYP_01189 [Methylophilaceae bacterium]